MADTNSSDAHPQAHGYPEPLENKAAYQAPPNPQNPPLKGLPLVISSAVVTHSPAIGKYFYGNTGWSKGLHSIEGLDDYIPTYVTNIVPKPAIRAPDASETSHVVSEEAYRRKNIESARAETKRFHTVLDYHEAYKTGRTTPTAVAEALLPLIRRDVPNASVHSTAFITTKTEIVLKAAREATARWKAGHPKGILDGVPIAMKDEIDLKGYPLTMGLKEPLKEASKDTSWCIQKLQDQGAVLVGKCNMHQIGLDTTNNNPDQGTPLNPYNDEYYTGGSTGGGAYAVAAGLVPFVQGSDAGGSIRVPSCFCGMYGLKPTHNRVSIRPTVNAAASTGVFGPLAATMADLEVAYRVMATPDAADPISKLYQAPARPTERRKVLGIYRQWVDESDAPVKDLFNKTVTWLQQHKGYELVDITIPYVHTGQAAHSLTTLAEIGSLLSEKEDIRKLAHPNRVLVTVGSHAPAKDFFAAQKLRTLINQHLAFLFRQHPGLVVVTPTVAYAGWKIEKGELARGMSNGNKTIRTMKYVWLANFCGLPSLSAPVGYDAATRVPVGIMGNGEWGSDDELVEFGFDVEDFLDSSEGGGRQLPRNRVDVLGELVGKGETQTAAAATTVSADEEQAKEAEKHEPAEANGHTTIEGSAEANGHATVDGSAEDVQEKHAVS